MAKKKPTRKAPLANEAQDYEARVRALVATASSHYPSIDSMRVISRAGINLAELLSLLPDTIDINETDEVARCVSVRLSIEILVRELSSALNPLKMPLPEAPLYLFYRGWTDLVCHHCDEVHIVLRSIVRHFKFDGQYEQHDHVKPNPDRRVALTKGRPVQALIDRLRDSARHIANALPQEAAATTEGRSGQPGRRGYPAEVLDFARKLRAENPDWTANEIRQQCLSRGYSADDMPFAASSFRVWLNRKRKGRR
jgi:hypothetical protein